MARIKIRFMREVNMDKENTYNEDITFYNMAVANFKEKRVLL